MVVHSKLKKSEVRMVIDSFSRVEVRILFNVSILIEGFDSPRLDCVVMARPTKSPAAYVQMAGRSLRLFEGKSKALIIDLVGNFFEHGPIDNPDYGDKKIKEPCEAKVCYQCLEIIPNVHVCPLCGYSIEKIVEFVQKNRFYDIKDLAFEDVSEMLIEKRLLKITDGEADPDYVTAAGAKCLKVYFYLDSSFNRIDYYFRLDKHYTVKQLAKIVKKFYPQFEAQRISVKRFCDMINGKHIFPFYCEVVKNARSRIKIKGL
jgi:hypothetical protein